MYEAGEKLALFDFDGDSIFDTALSRSDGYSIFDHGLSLKDVLHNEKKKMGHSFILIGLITGDRFWE